MDRITPIVLKNCIKKSFTFKLVKREILRGKRVAIFDTRFFGSIPKIVKHWGRYDSQNSSSTSVPGTSGSKGLAKALVTQHLKLFGITEPV